MPRRTGLHNSWTVLRTPIFAALWSCAVISNVGTLMQDVGIAWLMTSLSPSPLLVSLVQTAESVPFLLLALPAGALADLLDRRRLILVSQSWMCLVALMLGVLATAGALTPALLLTLTVLMSFGTALNGPVYQAIIPELVSTAQLPHAVAVNSAGFNLARAVGPGLGGLVVAWAGAEATFFINALSFLGVLVVIYRWNRPELTRSGPAEQFVGAMRAGLRYVAHSSTLMAVLLRAAVFGFVASVLWALLPMLARFELHMGAVGYGGLLACFGLGAFAVAAFVSRLRSQAGVEMTVRLATGILAVSLLVLGLSDKDILIGVALFLAGACWLAAVTTFNTSVQIGAAEWVRGRAIAIYLLVFFGSIAGGSATWGLAAEQVGVRESFLYSCGVLILTLGLARWYLLPDTEPHDLTPSRHWPAPPNHEQPDGKDGPVWVVIDYEIAPDHRRAFIEAMEELRHLRRRDGAFRWELIQGIEATDRFHEIFVIDSWAEHLRQHERVTVADQIIEAQARAFHIGNEPPRVRHFIAASLKPETVPFSDRILPTQWTR